jgi:hypothetical protein
MERVGSLNWLVMQTRPDIAKALLLLSKYLKAPTKDAFRYADYYIRYLLETQQELLELGGLVEDSPLSYYLVTA